MFSGIIDTTYLTLHRHSKLRVDIVLAIQCVDDQKKMKLTNHIVEIVNGMGNNVSTWFVSNCPSLIIKSSCVVPQNPLSKLIEDIT